MKNSEGIERGDVLWRILEKSWWIVICLLCGISGENSLFLWLPYKSQSSTNLSINLLTNHNLILLISIKILANVQHNFAVEKVIN